MGRAAHTALAAQPAVGREAGPLGSQGLPSGEGAHTEHRTALRAGLRGARALPFLLGWSRLKGRPGAQAQEMAVEQLISWWPLRHLADWRQSDGQTVNHVSGCP